MISKLGQNHKLMALFLFLLFLGASLPGISWGTPDVWNPDELVGRVDLALGGEIQFDETEPDYNYPSLPKYVMYGLGKIVYGLGYSRTEFIISARLLSALLGGLAVVLVFYLARRAGAGLAGAFLAGLLMTASGVLPFNARFGHNDMYLQLFVILCVFFLINYQTTKNRAWLYGSFYLVGLAASSKYTGGSMILLPMVTLILLNWPESRSNLLSSFEQLFIGLSLAFLGYATGTPKALLWPAFYFKRVLPALSRYPLYGLQPNSRIGLLGQWGAFENTVGTFIYYLFLIAFVWFTVKLILSRFDRLRLPEGTQKIIPILLLAPVIFDLPFMISVNYIPRYFIPFVPLFSILTALFITELIVLLQGRGYALAVTGLFVIITLGLAYSLLRVVSTALLFVNDTRSPASEYLKTLRPNTVIEYTLYPPIIPQGHFARTRNYPIFFLKYPGDSVPTNKPYDYNVGEAGLVERGVDYLVVDSFTYSRFEDNYICNSNSVECDFFSNLFAGRTRYRLLKEFTYALPPYLPAVTLAAVNPEVRVYERTP